MPDCLSSNTKLFADDTSLFSVAHDINTSATELNSDLKKINNWVFQWKMTCNPHHSKQAHEIIFSRKSKKATHSPLILNNNVSQVNSQTYLGVISDIKLTFEELLKNRTFKKLYNFLPRQALVTTYKAFIRPNLDYGDVLYDQAFNNSFQAKMKSIQYNACLAIPQTFRGTSREKIYQELGLGSLQLRCWYLKLCLFHKFSKINIQNTFFISFL